MTVAGHIDAPRADSVPASRDNLPGRKVSQSRGTARWVAARGELDWTALVSDK